MKSARHEWTPEDDDNLRRLLAEGKSFREIAFEMGLPSRNAPIGRAHRLGIADSSKARPRLSEKFKAKLASEYWSGGTAASIGKKYGVHKSTVYLAAWSDVVECNP